MSNENLYSSDGFPYNEQWKREAQELVKQKSIYKLCPDCGELLSYRMHFKAFMHPSSLKCAYMENKRGKRIWDNKMREEALQCEAENV